MLCVITLESHKGYKGHEICSGQFGKRTIGSHLEAWTGLSKYHVREINEGLNKQVL